MSETVIHQLSQLGFWGVSAGNVFERVKSAIMVCFGVRQLLDLCEDGGVFLAENSWIGMMA